MDDSKYYKKAEKRQSLIDIERKDVIKISALTLAYLVLTWD